MSSDSLPEGALSELLDAAPDGILLVGSDGRILYANEATVDLFGHPRQTLVGMTVERLIPGHSRSRHIRDRTEYISRPHPRPMGVGLQLQGLRSDGSEVRVEISLAPMTVQDRQLVVVIVHDATEQRKLEEERLRYAEAHAVEEIVAGLEAIVWESRTPDRESLTYLGGRQEVLLGYLRSQWLEPGFWRSLLHPDDRLAALSIAETAREQDTFELLYRMIAADGAVREMRDIISVTRDHEGATTCLRGVITDVTERREIADRLTQAQKMEAVGQLAGGIAHDFNNLLTIVSGYAQRLLSRPDLAGAREDLNQILTASDRAAQLTRELLAFARRGQSAATLIDVSTLVRDLEPMLRRLIAADIVFDFRLERSVPQVMMDRTVLEQILMNLLLNASDSMPTGGTLSVTTDSRLVGEAEARRRGLPPGEYALLSIADSGVGIPAAMLPRIFEPFFSTKGDQGTGMGLATVYGSIDQARGWIDVESAVGRGTTFEVMLPTSAGPEALPSAADEKRITLLLVEDEPALRKLVVTMLEEKGYAVLQAGNGLDAIAAAERYRGEIALLVTDVVMPRLSGLELAQQLRSLRPGVQVLFMSGYSDSRLLHRGVDHASVNLLVKPFTANELLARVHQLTEISVT